MQALIISLVFLFSLLLRFWITPKLDFGVDQIAIYEIGKKFYETGIIPAEGPRLVYTGESIPGGFQAIMAGFPLVFSHGEPIGLQLWVGFLNWVSVLLLFFWLKSKVKPESHIILAVFLAFSPWSILFSPAWNPSFLPVFSVLFFWILERVLDPNLKQKDSEPYFLGVIAILCLQLHLSAVLLAITMLIALPFIQKPIRFILSGLLGIATGGLFLIPWLIKKMEGAASAPTGVVGIHLENLPDIPKAFFRYISFSTSEISRFITPQGHGFQGMIGVLNQAPLLWFPALISFVGSGVLVFIFLKRWIGLSHHLKNGFSRIEFLLPILMTFTFLFSIKGASAHTFWILMPLSFYSMVSAVNVLSPASAWIYLIGSLVFTVSGFISI